MQDKRWNPAKEIQILPEWKCSYLWEKLGWYHTRASCMQYANEQKHSTFCLKKCPVCDTPVPDEAKTLATLQFLNEDIKR